MRVLILALFVAGAMAACTRDLYNETCPGLASGVTYRVSQVGPSPGNLGITGTQLTNGQADVRNGLALGSQYLTFTPTSVDSKYLAPYSGCYYFVDDFTTGTANPLYNVKAGPICTKNAERQNNGALNTRVAKAPELQAFTQNTGSVSLYTFSLKFKVDSAHAGVAFEFLNMNVATPADADTRCGVSYDNMTDPTPADGTIPSPHGGGFKIKLPGINATNGVWFLSRPDFDTAGFAIVNYSIADFNNALKNCGWKRDETTPDTTFFRAQVRATTVSQGQSIRGVLYKKYEETVVSIAVAFNTNVSATSGNLAVNAPLILFSEVTKQIFDPISKQAYLLLFTSSQGPYQLTTTDAQCTSDAGTDCKAWKNGATAITSPIAAFRPLAAGDRDALKLAPTDVGYEGVSTDATKAKCYADATTVAVPNYAGPESGWAPCNQFWFMNITGSTDCGDITTNSAKAQNLNGQWTVDFHIGCDTTTYAGSCEIKADGVNVSPVTSITFSTSSDNYCPRIIDTVSSTATLTVFQDRELDTQQDQFVFGTTSYFRADVTSSIKMQTVLSEEVAITQGEASDNVDFLRGITPNLPFTRPDAGLRQVLYSNGFPTSNGDFNAYFLGLEDNANSCAGRSGLNNVASSPIVSAAAGVTGSAGPPSNAQPGTVTTNCYASNNQANAVRDWSISQFNATSSADTALTAANYFQWYWNEAVSKASGDFAQITSVKWLGRIRYADQSTAKVGSWVASHKRLSAFDASSATVTSTVSGGPSSSASGSSAAVSTTTIAVAAAAVAAIAVMAIAAFVVLRSRNAKMETETNLESVTLGTMGSSAQLSA